MTSLKQIIFRTCIPVLGIIGFSCSGNSDEEMSTGLKLEASTSVITADGTDAVTFKVSAGDADVTSKATIRCMKDNSTVNNATFSTSTAGEYVFSAAYEGVNSNQVKITAKADDAAPSQFVRNICIMEFTGQWCGNCPAGYGYMDKIIERNFADVAHVIALHDNTMDEDEFALGVQAIMALDYKLEGYPSALVDMRDLGPLTGDINMAFRSNLEKSQNEYPAHCGVAVKSVYNATTKMATVTVRVHSEKTGNYKAALWVVEDEITARQNIGGLYEENYNHKHVARMLVSSTPNNYKGESLGEIPAGTEAVKEFTVPVDAGWNLENTSVYALAIGADGYVNNMAQCQIVNGDTDYKYIKETE